MQACYFTVSFPASRIGAAIITLGLCAAAAATEPRSARRPRVPSAARLGSRRLDLCELERVPQGAVERSAVPPLPRRDQRPRATAARRARALRSDVQRPVARKSCSRSTTRATPRRRASSRSRGSVEQDGLKLAAYSCAREHAGQLLRAGAGAKCETSPAPAQTCDWPACRSAGFTAESAALESRRQSATIRARHQALPYLHASSVFTLRSSHP